MDNPRVNKDRDRKETNMEGELSPTPKKRKLDQLKSPNDVDYNSGDSAKDGSDGSDGSESSESLRPRKQRKPLNSRKNPPAGLPTIGLEPPLPHDGTCKSDNDKRDSIDDRIEDERAVSTARPTSPSLQQSTSLRDNAQPHDRFSNGSHQILDDRVNGLTEEDDDGDVDNDDEDDDNHDDYHDNHDKADGCSDDGEDKGDDSDSNYGDDEDNNAHERLEQHRPSISVRGVLASKRAAEHLAQRSPYSSSTLSKHKSSRGTANTSNLHKPLAPPRTWPP